jgi:DMSO reductase anchor subunit
MHPAFSIVFFTTLAGSAQGLVVALVVATLAGRAPSAGFTVQALGVAQALLLAALAASFLHLGRPARAWRAVRMWRTSWMSREVIVLPAFMAVVGAWWLMLALGEDPGHLLPLLALPLCALLWLCTAMIYACLRFLQEWAHPLTVVNYTLIGLSSGWVLAGALAVLGGEDGFMRLLGPWALVLTLAALSTRALALLRNARLIPRSTLQTATGIRAERLVQKSMGFSGGSFNTREFFAHASIPALRRIQLFVLLSGFVLPAALLMWALGGGPPLAWLVAVPLQFLGLLAERWLFFAQARHPQNLYYQVVS